VVQADNPVWNHNVFTSGSDLARGLVHAVKEKTPVQMAQTSRHYDTYRGIMPSTRGDSIPLINRKPNSGKRGV